MSERDQEILDTYAKLKKADPAGVLAIEIILRLRQVVEAYANRGDREVVAEMESLCGEVFVQARAILGEQPEGRPC